MSAAIARVNSRSERFSKGVVLAGDPIFELFVNPDLFEKSESGKPKSTKNHVLIGREVEDPDFSDLDLDRSLQGNILDYARSTSSQDST